uniref:Uncharacterized protein n=1 Tax=Oryza sativa subsp. japonica TaxID=39947 RepID=Q6Z4G1_ORYSJ|nr:hypothetical protein [Oryza sativa Japonica Group]
MRCGHTRAVSSASLSISDWPRRFRGGVEGSRPSDQERGRYRGPGPVGPTGHAARANPCTRGLALGIGRWVGWGPLVCDCGCGGLA